MLRFSLTMRSLRKLCFHGLVDSVHKVLPQMFPSSRGLFSLVSGGQEEKSPPHTREKRPLLAGNVKCKAEAIFTVKSRVKSKRLQAQIPDYPLLQSPEVLILHSELQTKQTKQIIGAAANNFSLQKGHLSPPDHRFSRTNQERLPGKHFIDI